MNRNDFLRRISAFPLSAEKLSKDLLSGEFRSVFRGEGMEFDETRQYQQGDDVRYIDRNVSARYGVPFIKLFREERELTICVVLDCSASMFTGAVTPEGVSRYDQGALTAALDCYSAEKAGQRVGAILFDRRVQSVFAPKKGSAAAMSIINALMEAQAMEGGSGLGEALTGAMRLLKRRSLVVVISDFLCTNWEHELMLLREKHDVIAIRISDTLDGSFPKAGLIGMTDPETGVQIAVPSGVRSFRDAWTLWRREKAALWEAICRKVLAAHLEISTEEDPAPILARFFGGRKQQARAS
jgi:uncharacterized protein (DUF58 family)